MQLSFTAISFALATQHPHSICGIGLVRMANGMVSGQHELMVQPPNNYYGYGLTPLHNITAETTRSAPKFNIIWIKIAHLITGQQLIAASARSLICLQQVLEYYKLPALVCILVCIDIKYGESLKNLCRKYNITLQQHNLLSEAMACAEIYNSEI